jgi:hypothetical protein
VRPELTGVGFLCARGFREMSTSVPVGRSDINPTSNFSIPVVDANSTRVASIGLG